MRRAPRIANSLDDWKAAAMLGSLPKSYDTIVASLESRQKKELTASKVEGVLIDEYKRRQFNKTTDNESAMHVRGKKKTRNMSKVFCFRCKRKGHFQRDCTIAVDNTSNSSNNSNSPRSGNKAKANMVNRGESDSEHLFVTAKYDGGWIIDSGATCHIASNRDAFADFDSNFREKIFIANGQEVDVRGKGSIRLEVVNGNGQRRNVRLDDVPITGYQHEFAIRSKISFEWLRCKIHQRYEMRYQHGQQANRCWNSTREFIHIEAARSSLHGATAHRQLCTYMA